MAGVFRTACGQTCDLVQHEALSHAKEYESSHTQHSGLHGEARDDEGPSRQARLLIGLMPDLAREGYGRARAREARARTAAVLRTCLALVLCPLHLV